MTLHIRAPHLANAPNSSVTTTARGAASMPTTGAPAARHLAAAILAGLLVTTLIVPPAAARPMEPQPSWYAGSGPGVVASWNATAGAAAIAACLAPTDDPLHESRLYAMTHLAIHDALNAIHARFQPYTAGGAPAPGASPEAAVAAAARDVMVPVLTAIPAPFPPSCGASGVAVVEAAYEDAIQAVPAGPSREAGVAVGQQAAARILALRADDGSLTPLVDSAYPQGTAPGQYRFTPGNDFAFAPGWGAVTPFVERRWPDLRTNRPYDVGSRRYAADVAEVQRLGGDGVTTPSARTPDQTQAALFWVESSPLQWNRIARTVAEARHLDLWQSARLFALINVALADGYVGSFRTKYAHNFWRPVTAIRAAASDGNRQTVADPTWTPLVGTPPIPEHESAHAVQGAAAAQVMRRVLGTDRVAFSTCSLTLLDGQRCDDLDPVVRSYRSLSQAADENGESRILVGFHFRHAVEDGMDLGRLLGDRTVQLTLLPLSGRHGGGAASARGDGPEPARGTVLNRPPSIRGAMVPV